MAWLQAFHIIFMVIWFSGMFYLPRLFVYHALCDDQIGNERFKVMERKLLVMMTIGGIGTAVFGFWLLFNYAWTVYSEAGWIYVKLALVLFLFGYHYVCWHYVQIFRQDKNQRDHRFYRMFNEAPTIPMVVIIILVVVKPAIFTVS